MKAGHGAGRRLGARRRLALGAIGAVLAAAATACVAPAAPPAAPSVEGHVGTRQLELHLSGSQTYDVIADVDSGRLVSTWNGSTVATMSGSVGFAGPGGPATATFDLTRVGNRYDGSIEVADPGVGLSAVVAHDQVEVAFDGDGDGRATAVDGPAQLVWRTDSLWADGIEPELDELTGLEAEFCVDAQRSLVGVDETDLPTVVDTVHTSRDTFVASKVTYGPLGLHTWTDTDMATTADGNTVVLTHRLSCKTSSSDKLASLGVTTAPDAECSTLTAGSLATARAKMTQAQRDAYDTSGRQVALQPDVLAPAGPVWLAPFPDEVVNGSQLEVTASALRVDWTDPAYFGLPDNFRGVHYCTVWSPAWAYWWMTVGAFQP